MCFASSLSLSHCSFLIPCHITHLFPILTLFWCYPSHFFLLSFLAPSAVLPELSDSPPPLAPNILHNYVKIRTLQYTPVSLHFCKFPLWKSPTCTAPLHSLSSWLSSLAHIFHLHSKLLPNKSAPFTYLHSLQAWREIHPYKHAQANWWTVKCSTVDWLTLSYKPYSWYCIGSLCTLELMSKLK